MTELVADKTVVKERLAICNACEHYMKWTTQCKKCGCFMKLKTKLYAASCPIEKW